MVSDKIEKNTTVRAPLERVWSALTDSTEFGYWFGAKFQDPFTAGATVHGKIVPTSVDPEVAKLQQEYEGFSFKLLVETVEPMRLFTFRWHPFAIDKNVDYSQEPTTLVSFILQREGDGVKVQIEETGFENIPAERRDKAFSANEGGWGMALGLLAKYVEANR